MDRPEYQSETFTVLHQDIMDSVTVFFRSFIQYILHFPKLGKHFVANLRVSTLCHPLLSFAD
jgi:hypothetical protein